jgi:AcrR family transcriptional regulator
MTEAEAGRAAQRRRTRKAIVEAAARLLHDGADPSVAEIAAAADVSRRTVYMYFPRLDQLILDATVGEVTRAGWEGELDFEHYGADVHARVDAVISVMLDTAEQTLPLGRRLLKLTVDTPGDGTAERMPRRGYRRVEWIEGAMSPLRDRLSPEQFDRLVSALAVILGWEALIVLRDTRALPPDKEREVITWSAHALIDAALAEAGG